MAYTPATDFGFAGGGQYSPAADFNFSPSLAGTLAGGLPLFGGGLIGANAGINGAIAGGLPSFGAALIGATIAPAGGVVYTPATVFAFTGGGQYTPAADFNFSPSLAATLAGGLPLFAGTIAGRSIQNRAALSAGLPSLVGALQGQAAPVGGLAGTLPPPAGAIAARYDPNVHRYLIAATRTAGQAAAATILTARAPLGQTRRQAAAARLPAAAAAPVNPAGRLVYGRTRRQAIEPRAAAAAATPMTADRLARLDDLQKMAGRWRIDAAAAAALIEILTAAPQAMTPIRPDMICHLIADSGAARHDFIKIIATDPPPPWAYTPGSDCAFTGADYTPTPDFIWPYAMPRLALAIRHVIGIDGVKLTAPAQSMGRARIKRCLPVEQARRPPPGQSRLPDPPRPPPPPPGHPTVTIPTQQVYIMQHAISVKTVPGDIEVPMASVQLAYDADSFAWQFGGALADPAALALVQADSGVELAVTIDGYLWHVRVESIEHGIQFARHTINLRGRSLTAELGAPDRLPASATQGGDLTVQQIADSLMPPGWTITWDAPTWIVPAGAWSYTRQTPIQALAGLVNDIGCIAVPHPSQRRITVQRRYPVYPWYYAAAPADLAIPEAALTGVNLRPTIASQANGVYVHGGAIGGVLGWCRLTGSDGARLAPTVGNSLMTDVTACRLLGERILAGQQTQPVIKSATLPLDGDTFPLAGVGDLVQITLGGVAIKGVVNSVAIDASLSHVSQTLQIGEETANVWTAFAGLLPRDPLLVGTVASVAGDTAVVTLLDGGVISARGAAAVGDPVYIRAGRIEGPAPAMVAAEIVI